MNGIGKKLAILIAKGLVIGLFEVFRFTLFVLLLLAGRILIPFARLCSGAGLLIFLFCVTVRRDMVTPMWAGAAFAFGGVAFVLLYDALLAFVAPEGTVIITDL